MVNNIFSLFYIIFVNLLSLPATYITYKYGILFPNDFEANPLFAAIFRKLGVKVGLLFRHVWISFFAAIVYFVFVNFSAYVLLIPLAVVIFDSAYDIHTYLLDPAIRKKEKKPVQDNPKFWEYCPYLDVWEDTDEKGEKLILWRCTAKKPIFNICKNCPARKNDPF